MMRSAENHQRIIQPRFEQQIRVVGFALDEPDIQLIARQLLNDAVRVGDMQLDFRGGMEAQVFGHDQRCQIVADGQRGAHG